VRKKFVTGAAVLALLMNAPHVSADDEIVIFGGEFEDEEGADAGAAGDGLFLPDYFSPPDDVRDDANGHVVSRAWPVSAWFGWFRAAGLEVTALLGPPATPDAPYTSDDWANHGGQLDRIPSTVILVGVRR